MTTSAAVLFLIVPAISILAGLLPPLAAGDYVLYNGEVLMAGQNLTNGPYHLAMQTNCDLILYHDGKPAWRTNSTANSTAGSPCYAALKQNGELVVRRDVHYILWTSAKKGSKRGKYALVLDASGRLGIYGPRRWSSNNPKEQGPSDRPGTVVPTEYVLHSGRRLPPGKKLKYMEYELGLSRNCNLVINSTATGRMLWQTNTKAATCFLELESNGELMVKHGSQRLWSSNRKGNGGKYVAVLRFDGRFAVYGPLVWSNVKLDYGSKIADITYPAIGRIKEDMIVREMD